MNIKKRAVSAFFAFFLSLTVVLSFASGTNVLAEGELPDSSLIGDNTSVDTDEMTPEDWAALKNQTNSDSKEESSKSVSPKLASNVKDSSAGAFKDFKQDSVSNDGEWILILGIALVILGVAGIAFVIVTSVIRHRNRKKAAEKGSSKHQKQPAPRRMAND